jgi:hypothetical protein
MEGPMRTARATLRSGKNQNGASSSEPDAPSSCANATVVSSTTNRLLGATAVLGRSLRHAVVLHLAPDEVAHRVMPGASGWMPSAMNQSSWPAKIGLKSSMKHSNVSSLPSSQFCFAIGKE